VFYFFLFFKKMELFSFFFLDRKSHLIKFIVHEFVFLFYFLLKQKWMVAARSIVN
jgi:hypothetical protein